MFVCVCRSQEKLKDNKVKMPIKRKLDSDSPGGAPAKKKEGGRGRPRKDKALDMLTSGRANQGVVLQTPVQPVSMIFLKNNPKKSDLKDFFFF